MQFVLYNNTVIILIPCCKQIGIISSYYIIKHKVYIYPTLLKTQWLLVLNLNNKAHFNLHAENWKNLV